MMTDASMPPLELPEAEYYPTSTFGTFSDAAISETLPSSEMGGDQDEERYTWRPHMTLQERDQREAWLAESRGRKGLRIVIVTGEAYCNQPVTKVCADEGENFLPKVDGVTRTLARLLEHLQREGHQCMLLGPEGGIKEYSGHPLVGTLGVPLVVYPGLKVGSCCEANLVLADVIS
jgi:hypothetical protein